MGKKTVKKKAARSPTLAGHEKAAKVLAHAKTSVEHFIASYDQSYSGRGAPTDAQQDLLRAALVFAGAGLDGAVKELIRGCLPKLAESDERVRQEFSKFAERELRDQAGQALLAQLLTAETPRTLLLEQYTNDLTGSSLQSFEALCKAVKALGLEIKSLPNKAKLDSIFRNRNKIIHELDTVFAGQKGQRNRNSRTKKELQSDANELVKVGEKIIEDVKKKLQ